jgi:multicomponent Na+:H+ antiporter subunit D
MAASLPVCAVLSGVVAELGLYALTRVYWTCFSGGLEARQNDVRNLLAAFGALSALLGAAMCYAQRDLKRLLAYSTVSQMGLMLLGIALLTPRGLAGAELIAVSHATLKGGLFLSAGMLLRRAGEGDELQLAGRGCDFQWMSSLFFVGAAGLAAVPPFSAFWGENLLDGSARSLGYFWIPWLAFAAYALSTAAIFRFSFRVFFGKRWRGEEFGVHSTVVEPGIAKEAHSATPAALYGPAAALIALGVITGVAPRITGAAEAAAIHIQNREAYARRILDMLTPFPPVVQDQPAAAADVFRAALVLIIGGTAGWLAARGRTRQ